MKTHRVLSTSLLLLMAAAVLVSCKVDKQALARQVSLQDPDLRSVPDGVYEAAYTITPPPGVMAANKSVRVRVTVSGGRYQDIELLEPASAASSKTYQALVARLLESQKVSVDAISGATITSMAVLKAVQAAVQPTGK